MNKIKHLFLIIYLAFSDITNASIFFNNITSFDIQGYTDYLYNIEVQNKKMSVYSTAFYVSYISGNLPSGYPTKFVSFCLDIDNPIGTYFVPGHFSDLTITYDDPPITRQDGSLQKVGKLYNYLSSGIVDLDGNWLSKEKGAALQLAIWEILYEQSPNYDLMSGSFKVISGSDPDIVDASNDFVALIYEINTSVVDTVFWNATDSLGRPSKNQDIIGPPVNLPEIPLPYQFTILLLFMVPFLMFGKKI